MSSALCDTARRCTRRAGQTVIPGVLAALSMSVVERPFLDPSARLFVATLLVGLLATALAMSTLVWAMQHTTATRGAVICSAEPARGCPPLAHLCAAERQPALWSRTVVDECAWQS